MKRIITLLICCLSLLLCCACGAPAAEVSEEPEASASPQLFGADFAIESVTAIGCVDIDGVRLRAIALKYCTDLTGADVSADLYELETSPVKSAENLGSGKLGSVTAVYVNDEPAVSETGGSGSGNYVIVELYNDYLGGAESNFATALICGVKQQRVLTADNAMIAPNTETLRNYSGGLNQRPTLNNDGFIVPEVESFQWFTDYPEPYGADGPSFVAYDCFDEKSGESVECHLGYGLYLPEDWHEDGRYAMVVLDNPATVENTHPVVSALETRSPSVYASDWAQQLVRDAHGLDGLIVVVPVVTARVDDNGCSPAEYEALVQLWDYLADTYSVDKDHIYGSGQSVGGMVLLETNRNRDNYFAGLMLYEDQWCQNYYKDTLFIRNQASEPDTAASAPMHYPRVKDHLTWDYSLDTNGQPVYENHDPNNYYYLISDDNILIMNREGNALSNDTWQELAYLYEDLTGERVEQHHVSAALSLSERDADIAEYLAREGDTGIKWVSFENGVNGYTCRQVMAGYEWLLRQDRQSEIRREKLDINKPFVPAAEQIKSEERLLHFTDADGGPLYYLTAQPGAGTQLYNTCWLNMGTVADAAPGWLPDGMSWDTGVSAAAIKSVTALCDDSGRLLGVAVEYDADMSGLIANLRGDDIIGLDGTVREDIQIVLDPYEFFDGETPLEASVTNLYISDTPALRSGAERGSGAGSFVIAELDTDAHTDTVGVRQITTLRTDTVIASASPKIYR